MPIEQRAAQDAEIEREQHDQPQRYTGDAGETARQQRHDPGGREQADLESAEAADKTMTREECDGDCEHDEIVVECDAGDADTTKKIVEDAMCAAGEEYVRAVPVKVEAKVADEWVK